MTAPAAIRSAGRADGGIQGQGRAPLQLLLLCWLRRQGTPPDRAAGRLGRRGHRRRPGALPAPAPPARRAWSPWGPPAAAAAAWMPAGADAIHDARQELCPSTSIHTAIPSYL